MSLAEQASQAPLTDPARLALIRAAQQDNAQLHYSPGHDPDCEECQRRDGQDVEHE